jgi:DEAD/DEAH box helicase domain-containing protein
MLPSVVSRQVDHAIRSFLTHSFEMSSPLFFGENESGQYETAMDVFLAKPGNLSRGPYISINLPFRQSTLARDYFSNLYLSNSPYAHQSKAYERLTSAKPQSTLVATGTGSGKTECFMHPILNYCASNKTKGIKAIIIYPMNALATDQAARFAETIYENTGLKNKVTVGLFVGQEDENKTITMTPDKVITCKDTLRKNPPDILMTNYKMLDFLLLRPKDQSIWKDNEPETLQFMVVDELHTFDGAQGTDLSCLIRRLKHRLQIPKDYLACVGTSATIGNSFHELTSYAHDIFDAEFDTSSVVTEDRYGAEEYLADSSLSYFILPKPSSLPNWQDTSTPNEFINQSIRAWFDDEGLCITADWESEEGRQQRIDLGNELKKHRFFHQLLRGLNGAITSSESIAQDLLGAVNYSFPDKVELVENFCSLISIARIEQPEDELVKSARIASKQPIPVMPLLQVRFQLWLRELRRMVASVGNKDVLPQLTFSDDLTQVDSGVRHLPVVHCRDCHATGWGGVLANTDAHVNDELQMFYQLYFDNRPEAALFFPVNKVEQDLVKLGRFHQLCCDCLFLNNSDTSTCASCSKDHLTLVFMPQDSQVKSLRDGGAKLVAKHNCPFCHSTNGLSVLGSRAASLISVMSQQLFASHYNEDKQLITFSDSVQDAAHRAGFFTARTYPLLIRSLFAKVISEKAEGKSLTETAQLVGEYALEESGENETFVGTYISPDMEWQSHYKEIINTGKLPAKTRLVKHVQSRLGWDLFSEFGLKGDIGRSLNKSFFAVLSFEPEKLNGACLGIHSALCEEIHELADISPVLVEQFVIGVLHLMSINGAIYHPGLKGYVREAGDSFVHNKIADTQYYMPNFGRRSRKPRFLSARKVSSHFDHIQYKNADASPYLIWLAKTVTSNDFVFAAGNAVLIFERTFAALLKHGIIAKEDVRDEAVYGLNPDAIFISKHLLRYNCISCQTTINVDKKLEHYWLKAPCTVASCKGHFLPAAKTPVTTNWDNADLVRINGAEHTGLLERPVREKVELSFIKGKKSWDTNLLSATPTLEMGINIGNLSSVALCSVPPSQSNYLQRIGRAGRRDGNAFNVTFSEGNPHDLYYYDQPLTMMSGAVEPPGVFLQAIAVLERQLTAFCFDNWVATGIDDSIIPRSVRDLLNAVEGSHTNKFPYLLFDYIEKHQGTLFEHFKNMFDSFDADSSQHLAGFIRGDGLTKHSLSWRIINRLQQLIIDRNALNLRVKKIDSTLKKLEKEPVKEADHVEKVSELTNERQAIRSLIRQINGKQTLNFFTDEGLLPNYAFPEEGVTIRSILWRRREADESAEDGTKFFRNTYDYERPAASALSELAPDNYFYAGGQKVEIEQIDLNVSEVETWRVCNNCHHAENVDISKDEFKTCPSCNSVVWNDKGQLTQMVKLRQVYARTNERDAKISDDTDNREPKFYKRQMLVTYQPEDVFQAYKIDNEEVPFGFDFLKKVNIKDINFGVPDSQIEQTAVAGDTAQRSGFKVCNKCGMVKTKKQKVFKHDFTCPHNKTPETANDPQNFIDCLYLYRVLESEAIRIVLPVSNYSVNSANEASFAAAIQLGIKHYFKGSIDHIKSTTYSEPVNEGEGRRYYLVIYDSIPGGTGYLKELMRDPDNLFTLIEKSFTRLDMCSCNQDPNKDGCYKCIYAYRDRQKMPMISRDSAKNMFQTILENRKDLIQITSLSQINPNVLLDSELEHKFIETLKVSGNQWQISHSTINGKNGYILTVGAKDSLEYAWRIEPQVNLNDKHGVSIASKPDFIFWPARESANIKPIAVFLDGYEFHFNKVNDDTQKRQAIVNSGKFLVWTLYWDDLTHASNKHFKEHFHLHQNVGLRGLLGSKISSKNYEQWQSIQKDKNSFELFSDLVTNPTQIFEQFKHCATVHSFCWLSNNGMSSKNPKIAQKLELELSENTHESRVLELVTDEPFWFGGLLDSLQSSEKLVEIAVAITLDDFTGANFDKTQSDLTYLADKLKVHVCFDDEDKEHINFKSALIGYWKVFNLLQCMTDVTWCTKSSINWEQEPDDADKLVKHPVGENALEWTLLIKECLLEGELQLLVEAALILPEVGYELMDGDVVVALAEMAWAEKKIAVFSADEVEDFELFKSNGWTCLTDPVNKLFLEQLKERIGA